MSWQRLTQISDTVTCGTCGARHDRFHFDDVVVVGFGEAYLSRDGVKVADGEAALLEQECDENARLLTGMLCELLASQDPDHDWRIVLNAPLTSHVYQRQADGFWPLVERGGGFA